MLYSHSELHKISTATIQISRLNMAVSRHCWELRW